MDLHRVTTEPEALGMIVTALWFIVGTLMAMLFAFTYLGVTLIAAMDGHWTWLTGAWS
jgi:hypothetical protein